MSQEGENYDELDTRDKVRMKQNENKKVDFEVDGITGMKRTKKEMKTLLFLYALPTTAVFYYYPA